MFKVIQCLKIYELDPAYFFHTSISMARNLKNSKVKSDLLTDTDMLLMVKKVSEEEYVMLSISM